MKLGHSLKENIHFVIEYACTRRVGYLYKGEIFLPKCHFYLKQKCSASKKKYRTNKI